MKLPSRANEANGETMWKKGGKEWGAGLNVQHTHMKMLWDIVPYTQGTDF